MNFIENLWKRLTPGKHVSAFTKVEAKRILGARQLENFWKFAVDLAERSELCGLTFDLQIPWFHEGFHASWHRNKVSGRPGIRVTKELIFRDGESAKVVLEVLGEANAEKLAAQLVARARLISLFSAESAIEDVSPPAVTIVWDPEIVSTSEYAQLVNAIGEIVRSEGAIGLKLIDSDSCGVAVESEVLV